MPVARRDWGLFYRLENFRENPSGHTKDIDLGGILVAPFVRYLFLALVILIAVRFVVGRIGLRSMFANPPLAEAPCTSASSPLS
jgi:hypothetical protein